MKIRLVIFGEERKEQTLDVNEGVTVRELLTKEKIRIANKQILVNGLHAKESTVLKDADRLSVVVPMQGG